MVFTGEQNFKSLSKTVYLSLACISWCHYYAQGFGILGPYTVIRAKLLAFCQYMQNQCFDMGQ